MVKVLELTFVLKIIFISGGQGSIYTVEDIQTRKIKAMKTLYCDDYEQVNQIIKEINFVKELNHPNLLSYEEIFMKYDEENEILSVNIIMKFCVEGLLKNLKLKIF